MENKVLAKIGNVEITDNDLDRIINRYPVEKRIYFETENGRKSLLEQKKAFVLFSQYARQIGKDKEEEYLLHIRDLEEQLLTQSVMQDLFAGIEVTDREAEKFYQDNPERFALEATVEARHILVDTEEAAEEIYKKLSSGKISFEDAAKEYSICPSKDKGGNLGYFKRGMMVREFEDAAFSMEMHKISNPVKSQFGYHIIEVLNRTEPGTIPFEQVAEELKKQLLQAKQQEVYEKKLSALKAAI